MSEESNIIEFLREVQKVISKYGLVKVLNQLTIRVLPKIIFVRPSPVLTTAQVIFAILDNCLLSQHCWFASIMAMLIFKFKGSFRPA